jgi:hypothetical protein
MSSTSKIQKMALVRAMLAGLLKHFAGKTLTLNGAEVQVADVTTTLNGYEPQVTATAAAETAWKAQVQAEDTMETTVVDPLMLALGNAVRAAFGVSSPTLNDFGVAPRKPRVRTAEEKAASAAKSKATRALRNTMGKRQKAAIHAPAAPAPAPTESTPAPETPALAPTSKVK